MDSWPTTGPQTQTYPLSLTYQQIFNTLNREREREGSEPIPSSEEGEVLVIPLQLEEASKGIALIPNPSFNILLSFPLKILILFGIMLSLWISPLVASIMMALMDFAC
ncbi:hypothetical protein GmHk_11G033208 [Glycine max]|nr:hypothetical protein GmHk_11G033208 [Glycine max]